MGDNRFHNWRLLSGTPDTETHVMSCFSDQVLVLSAMIYNYGTGSASFELVQKDVDGAAQGLVTDTVAAGALWEMGGDKFNLSYGDGLYFTPTSADVCLLICGYYDGDISWFAENAVQTISQVETSDHTVKSSSTLLQAEINDYLLKQAAMQVQTEIASLEFRNCFICGQVEENNYSLKNIATLLQAEINNSSLKQMESLLQTEINSLEVQNISHLAQIEYINSLAKSISHLAQIEQISSLVKCNNTIAQVEYSET